MSIKALEGDSWSARAARILLPLLIECAQQKRTVYYSEARELLFAQGISRAHTTTYGYVAGLVGEALLELSEQEGCKPYPPLNVLVVAKKDNLPGSGADYHLGRYLGLRAKNKIQGARRQDYIAQAQKDIFAFEDWNTVLEKVGLARLRSIDFDTDDSLPDISYHAHKGTGEGPAHASLKHYIAENPEVIGLGKSYRRGKTERGFACADRVDVFFEHEQYPIAVECKTAYASNDELTSGIFQCVKYKALLEAEILCSEKKGTPKSILAVGRVLPNQHQRLATLLGVEWVFVKEK